MRAEVLPSDTKFMNACSFTIHKVDVSNSIITIIWTTILEWYVDLRTDTTKTYVYKRLDQNMLTILGSIIDIIGGSI